MRKLLCAILGLSTSLVFADTTVVSGKPHSAKVPQYMEVYGHRGARAYVPENVIPAYQASMQTGIDWVDMDIGVTKDGIVVVDHDIWLNPDIVRNPDGKFFADSKDSFYKSINNKDLDKNIQPYLVHNLTLAQLKTYDVGMLNPKSPYGKYFPDQVVINGTRMPSLQEVIDFVERNGHGTLHYQIEFKNDPAHPEWTQSPKEFAKSLYTVLKKNHLINKVEVQSFDWACLFELQKLDKNIKTAYLVGSDDKERMVDPDPKKAGAWSGGFLLKDYHNSLPQMIKALGGSCYEPEDVALTKEEVDESHKLGLKVVVWTWPEHSGKAFDPVVVQRMIDWGIDGIITDDPARLNAMLAARDMRTPKNFQIIKN